jgi:HEPN domain-containing protein
MAAYARRRKLYVQCVFHCHQAVEKMLKAIWEERQDVGSPPKTHNLAALANELFQELSAQDSEFLQRLARQYLPARYAEYEPEYSLEETGEFYTRTGELFSWLRQQLI